MYVPSDSTPSAVRSAGSHKVDNMTAESLSFPRQHAATRRFTLGAPRDTAISPDGSTVYFLRSKHGSDPILCLWAIDIASSTERLVVDPAALGSGNSEVSPAERTRRERARESASGIVRYTTDAEYTTAVMELGGSIVVTELSTGDSRLVPCADGLFDARIDPTGRWCAYVADRSLRLLDLGSGDDIELAGERDPLVSWGRADFIAGEEMGRTRGFWWAPDGSGLLATRVADHNVTAWYIADPANPATVPNEIRYPAAGTTNADVQLVHIALNGTQTPIHWREAPGPAEADVFEADLFEADLFEYLADIVWSAGHPPLVVRQPRHQRLISIASIDTGSGAVKEIQTITDPTWVELIPGSPTWTDRGLLTVEDRTDLDRRVLCLDGQVVSRDELHVRSIVAVDDGRVVVTGWTDSTEVHVATIDVDRPDAPARFLTTEPGVHNATAAGEIIVITSATPETSAISVRIFVNGGPVAMITSHVEEPVISAAPQFLRLGERSLASAMFFPANHDGTSPLPVLLDPYGGPHAQRVLKNHLSHLTSQWFADQGFAVLVVDNRGTPGRGPAFEREVWGDLASPVLDDQIDALDAAAEEYPCLDLTRVGIRGWSFGGYLAALAVMRAPGRIHAAIAGAPVTDWQLYDTHYTERYLGHPDTDPAHYATSSLINEAAALTRPLFLIHGLADDNVVAAHTLQLSSALLAAGRAHAVLPLSGVTHMTPQEVVAENLLHLQRDFLLEHLGSPTEAA